MRFQKTLTLLMLAMGLVFALSAWAQQKPFTRDQVQGLVRDGIGDEAGAKLIEQRGIDFAPAEDFLQSLKAAGASEAFLKALRAAKWPERESAKTTKRATVHRAAQARQDEIHEHVARGAELKQKGQYAEAEQEYRAALLLDSQNADLYESLSYVLIQQKKWDDGTSAARQAVRLNPNNDVVHSYLGSALGGKGDVDGEIAEYREALRLNPTNEDTHLNLGVALGRKGDVDGEIAEEREALRLNPTDDLAHYNLGVALGNKGDLDGEIAEEREALRLNPNDAHAHVNLGVALGNKGDLDGAVAEYREALRLDPTDDMAHYNLGVALGIKGDVDGAVAEYREALRLNPNNTLAHSHLGSALKSTGKPRVFIESWFAGGVFKAAREPDSTTEMTAFAQSCPQSTVTIDDQSADYTLRMSHVNDPRFHDGLSQIVNNQLHLIYGYTLFDHQGNMVGSQPVGASLTEAAEGACKAVLSNWMGK